MPSLKKLFRDKSETILIYVNKETVDDPYENNITETAMTPIPIKAIVYTEKPESLQWKFSGIKTDDAKGLIIKANQLTLMRLSHKIDIGGNDYNGYKDNDAKLVIYELEDNEYIRVNVFRRT